MWPNIVIIVDLNSTVNVTCCVSTLPFSVTLNAPVPKTVALDADRPNIGRRCDSEGVLRLVILNDG